MSIDRAAATAGKILRLDRPSILISPFCSALAHAILDPFRKGTCGKYVQLLLDAGADVNFRGGHYGSPLAVSSALHPAYF